MLTHTLSKVNKGSYSSEVMQSYGGESSSSSPHVATLISQSHFIHVTSPWLCKKGDDWVLGEGEVIKSRSLETAGLVLEHRP